MEERERSVGKCGGKRSKRMKEKEGGKGKERKIIKTVKSKQCKNKVGKGKN